MADEASGESKSTEAMRPSVRDYTLVSVAALLVVGAVLLHEGLGYWATLAVLLVGAAGAVANWGLAPQLVLLLVTLVLGTRNWRMGLPLWYRVPSDLLSDLSLGAALLVYVVASARLQTLTRHGAPPRPGRFVWFRRRRQAARVADRWMRPAAGKTRRLAEFAGVEILFLVFSAVGAVVLGQALWSALAVEAAPEWLDLPPAVWRCTLLVWVAGVCLVAAHGLQAYLAASFASREESLLVLQDEMWAATRGEQRRVWRWLTWARLRRQKVREEEGRRKR